MKLLMTLAVLAVLLFVAVWAGQRRLIYFPSRSVRSPDEVGLAHVEAVRFTADDGVHLAGWFAPAEGAGRDLAVLVCHGNGGNVMGAAPLLRQLPQLGLSVLAFDYRGYGASDDVAPTEDGLYCDGRAARAWLQERTGLPPDRIVLLGESLGSGVAVELAAEAGGAPHALILESPFTALADVGAIHYPWLPVRLMLRDRFDNAARIGRVHAPLLVFHGAADQLVPITLGRALAARAGGTHRLVELSGVGHNEVWRDGAARRADVAAFLDEIAAQAAASTAPTAPADAAPEAAAGVTTGR